MTFAFQPTDIDEPVNIRTATVDGAPWFVGADALRVLGLHSQATTAHVSRLHPDDVSRVSRSTLSLPLGAPMVVLSEAGLYIPIARSDKPQALVFQRWLHSEVLPAIRKTGGYLLNETARATAHADTRTEMPLHT